MTACRQFGSASNYTAIDNNGRQTMVGNARVSELVWLSTEAIQIPLTKPAALVEHGIALAHEFTDGTDDTIMARIRLPDDMDRSATPQFGIGWSTPTASAGNGRWQVEYVYRAANEAMNAAAEETLVNDFAASATAGGLTLSYLTPASGPGSTDICVMLRVKRRADEANDTLGEDCHLHGICMKYTANSLGTSL